VRYAGERPCELPPPAWVAKAGGPATSTVPEEAPAESLGKRLKDRVKGWLGRK